LCVCLSVCVCNARALLAYLSLLGKVASRDLHPDPSLNSHPRNQEINIASSMGKETVKTHTHTHTHTHTSTRTHTHTNTTPHPQPHTHTSTHTHTAKLEVQRSLTAIPSRVLCIKGHPPLRETFLNLSQVRP